MIQWNDFIVCIRGRFQRDQEEYKRVYDLNGRVTESETGRRGIHELEKFRVRGGIRKTKMSHGYLVSLEASMHFSMLIGTTDSHLSQVSFADDSVQIIMQA